MGPGEQPRSVLTVLRGVDCGVGTLTGLGFGATASSSANGRLNCLGAPFLSILAAIDCKSAQAKGVEGERGKISKAICLIA